MFRFQDVTSLLGSSAGAELDLGCRILEYGSREKHDSGWKSWRMRDWKKAKAACLWFAFLCHIHLCSYYQVGLGVVQMVRYFKTSLSIRVIAPLNGLFKSELWRHVQNQRHIKRTICTFICSVGKTTTNTHLVTLSGHFTSNMSRNVHAGTYFTSCKKVLTGTFSSWDQVAWSSCWPRCIRYVQLQPQAGRQIPSKLSIEKCRPAVLKCLLTRSDTRNGGVKMCLCFASWFFDIMLHLLHSGWREKLSCFSRLDNYFSLIPCARPNLSPQ